MNITKIACAAAVCGCISAASADAVAEAEKGERRAVLEMRTQYAGYFRGLYNFKPVRLRLMGALTIEECEDILHSYSIN